MTLTKLQSSAVTRLAGLFLFLCLLFPPLPASAHASVGRPVAGPVISTAISLPPAASWWGKFYAFCESSLSSRTRMIQLGVLGMFFALLIMMKK